MLRRNSLTQGAKHPRPASYNSHSGKDYVAQHEPRKIDVVRGDPSLTESRAIKKIEVSDHQTVTRLDLSNSQIKGETTFWMALKPLTNLTTLNLQHCGLLYAYLGYLPEQITSLNLNDNYVQELSLNRYFPQLKNLECRNNRLLKANFPGGNPSLEFLAVSHNKLSILNTVQLSGLQELEADHNELVVINLNPTVKKVQLRNCSLKSLMFMSKLKSLQELDVSNNQLSDVRLNSYLPKLELGLLDLSNNGIKYVEGLELACPNLKQLLLNNNELYSLKGIYCEVVKLQKLEVLDLLSNEFERSEDEEHVRQVILKLQKQLSNIRTINRMLAMGNINTRGSREIRSTENSRRKDPPSLCKPLRELQTSNKQNKIPLKSIHAQSSSYGNSKKQQIAPATERTPPKDDTDTPSKTFRASSNSQFKQSPYRLCSDLLASVRDYSGHKTLPHRPVFGQKVDQQANFTLGEKDQKALALQSEKSIEKSLFQEESILVDEHEQVVSRDVDNRSYQNVSFGVKKTTNQSLLSLSQQLKNLLSELLELCWIPVRPILKSQRNRDICCRVDDGPEVDLFEKYFGGYHKRPDLIKKNTNFTKLTEILERSLKLELPSVGFLKLARLDGRLFRQVTTGKLPFTALLCETGKASISYLPDQNSSWHIIVLTDHLDMTQLSSEGIPIEQVDRLTPIYYIETNDTRTA